MKKTNKNQGESGVFHVIIKNNGLDASGSFADALVSKCLIQFWQRIFRHGIGKPSLLP
jgi:hypothetical protein